MTTDEGKETTPLYSIRIEKHVLGGLIKNPKSLVDITGFVKSSDFFVKPHQVIFGVLENLILTNTQFDEVTLAQRINDLGVKFKDNINIFDYIQTLAFTQITPNGTLKAAKELIKLRIKREICATADSIKNYLHDTQEEDIDKIIAEADAIYNRNITSYSLQDEPVDVFEGLADLIEERGNSPIDEIGYPTLYPEFNRLFGGVRPGNIYAIVARPGQAKSTMISDMCYGIAKLTRFKIPVLILDTEMNTTDVRFRLASSITGVPFWHLETGNWRKNTEMFQKVRTVLKDLEAFNFFHYQVANKNIDEIVSIIRRWYYLKVGRGNRCIVAYDYIKLTGENVAQNWAEHQAIGEKINKLKRLSDEIHCPIITAMQLNRTGENFNKNSKDVTDDSSAISLSDRLQWFASFVAILRRKTLDEIEDDGIEFGTHKLIPTKTRFQGKDAAGHQDLVLRPTPDGKKRYVNNYLNYDIANFKVTEKGSLRDVVEAQKLKYNFNKDDKKPDATLE